MIHFVTTALAADPVLDGVAAEVDRALSALRLPEAEGPYHVDALVYDVLNVGIAAQLGGIVRARVAPDRTLGLVVHVGTEQLDNTNFESFEDGVGSRELVLGDDPVAVRHDTWLLADRLYKEAVEALAAKRAADERRAEPDDVPDFAPGAPRTATAEPAPPVDPAALEAFARELSAVFLRHPDVEWSTVYAAAETGRRLSIDSGGTRVIEPVSEVAVRVIARGRAADGATVVDQELFLARTIEDLPAREEALARVEALAERLVAWRTLPVPEEEYVGPVLFEDGAAVDLFRLLLVPALQGTPPAQDAPRGSRVFVFDEDSEPSAMQPRRRVLPTGWDVDDDPQRDPDAVQSYRHDHEGQPAERVVLVEDGIVRGHLMSRIPNEWFPGSNGHARAFPGQLPRALPADVRVTPDREAPARKLHKTALKLAQDYGFDHYVAVRRLRDPSVASLDGGPVFNFRQELGWGEEAFPAPVVAVRVYADGREEPIRGVALSGLDGRSLKEIVLAGEMRSATVLVGGQSDRSGSLSGFPAAIAAPEVLLGEVVVAPDREDAEKPPALPSPLAERRTDGG